MTTVLIGEQQPGRAAEVRNLLEKLVLNINKSNFDLGELLNEVKQKTFYMQWGFNTFAEYVESLDVKVRRANYLSRIVEVMDHLGVERAEYEPIGVSKLREITSIEPDGVYVDKQTGKETPTNDLILGLVEKAPELDLTEIKNAVKVFKGLDGDDELVWLNFCVKKAAKELTIQPAIDLARANIGTLGQDEDGMAVDASDGKCLEMIAVEYLENPTNQFLGENNG